MNSELEKEAPNVVREVLFRHLVARGYMAEIVCQEAAFRKASIWYGEWIVRLVNEDRTFSKVLITSPRRPLDDLDDVKVRLFKTINGLTSFMHEVGFAHLDVPLIAGGRSLQTLPDEVVEQSNNK